MSCADDTTMVIYQGDDEVFRVELTDTDEDGVETPVDLTGCVFYLAIKQDGVDALKVDLRQDTHTDAANGISSITIPKATTAVMEPEAPHRGVLRMKSAGGDITTQGEFPVVVRPSISTRDD